MLVSNSVSVLTVTAGSGYTNGTGYALSFSGGGCSAQPTGTIDVVGGSLINAQLLTHGSGCTAGAGPTVSLPGGVGAGTGGVVTTSVYSTRPSWNIAGVDYAVGPRSSPTKVAGVDPAPSCVTQTAGQWNINSDNCVISGWTLTNWLIQGCNSSANPTITDNIFIANQPVLDLQGTVNSCSDSDGYNISYNTFDGTTGTTAWGDEGFILHGRQGTTVAQYNLFKNSPSDQIDASQGNVTIRYNVFVNNGYRDGCSGASLHPDVIQTGGFGAVYTSFVIDFNFVVQSEYPCGGTGGGSQGFTLDGNTNGCPTNCPVFDGGHANNNVILLTATPKGATGQGMRFAVDQMPASSSFTTSGNYIDPTGLTTATSQAFQQSSSGTTCGTCTWLLNGNVNLIGATPSTWNTNVPG